MKIKKIIGILIAFFVVLMFFTIDSYAKEEFKEGDTVITIKKSYKYEAVGLNENSYKRMEGEDNFFDKGTIFIYLQLTEDKSVCRVKSKNGGMAYFIKVSNLEPYETKYENTSSENVAAKRIYDKYKNQDVKNLSDSELETSYNECRHAKEEATEEDLKLNLENIIRKIQVEAENREIQVNEDGSIRKWI